VWSGVPLNCRNAVMTTCQFTLELMQCLVLAELTFPLSVNALTQRVEDASPPQ
jgi:hypothetical protein